MAKGVRHYAPSSPRLDEKLTLAPHEAAIPSGRRFQPQNRSWPSPETPPSTSLTPLFHSLLTGRGSPFRSLVRDGAQ